MRSAVLVCPPAVTVPSILYFFYLDQQFDQTVFYVCISDVVKKMGYISCDEVDRPGVVIVNLDVKQR